MYSIIFLIFILFENLLAKAFFTQKEQGLRLAAMSVSGPYLIPERLRRGLVRWAHVYASLRYGRTEFQIY